MVKISKAQLKEAKSNLIIIRALIDQYLEAGDHKMVDICTDTLEKLHEVIEECEGPSVDPDTRVC